VLGLGRVTMLSAKIMRAIEASGLMGAGIRALGTHALYAYEAAAMSICSLTPASAWPLSGRTRRRRRRS
jgi:hypothetical protein